MHRLSMAWWYHKAKKPLVNTASGNDMLPDGTKQLPEPILIDH